MVSFTIHANSTRGLPLINLSIVVSTKFMIHFLVVRYRCSMVMLNHSDHRSRRCPCVAISHFPHESIGESPDSMTKAPVIVLECGQRVPQSNPTPNSANLCCRTHFQFLQQIESRKNITMLDSMNSLVECQTIDANSATHLPNHPRLSRLHCLLRRLCVCLYLSGPSIGCFPTPFDSPDRYFRFACEVAAPLLLSTRCPPLF